MDNEFNTEQKDPRPKKPKDLLSKYRVDARLNLNLEHGQNNRISQRAVVASGIEPYTGEWNNQHLSHLLRRTLFGLRKSEVDQFSSSTIDEVVNTILQPSTIPPPPVNDYNEFANSPDPNVGDGETWTTASYGDDYEGLRIHSLRSWITDQMLNQETSIHQKLVLFWHNLLPTEMQGVFVAKAAYQYWKMLLDNAFGNYKDLIKKLTLDTCMLIYLNGTRNNKNAPDENYGRELQELFCIGKGPNSGYTEGDVQSAARVLTGWQITNSVWEEGEGMSVFNGNDHDTNNKRFSSFYGDTLITGKIGQDGALELDEMLDMIFNTNEVALYICRRLYNFFVYHDIDSITETNVIEPLAQIFRDNNYDILPVLTTLFKSAHFYDAGNMGAVIKNPADHLLGLWRTLEIPSKGLSEETPADKLLRNVYMDGICPIGACGLAIHLMSLDGKRIISLLPLTKIGFRRIAFYLA